MTADSRHTRECDAMKEFFGDDLLLGTESAKELFASVRDLPIIDYHCHLDQTAIKRDDKFEDIGQLWLAGDHYKWRAMRMCGVDEKYNGKFDVEGKVHSLRRDPAPSCGRSAVLLDAPRTQTDIRHLRAAERRQRGADIRQGERASCTAFRPKDTRSVQSGIRCDDGRPCGRSLFAR